MIQGQNALQVCSSHSEEKDRLTRSQVHVCYLTCVMGHMKRSGMTFPSLVLAAFLSFLDCP